MKNAKPFLLIAVSLAALAIQLRILDNTSSLFPWQIPISWGFIKVILDIPIVFMFSWGGWPAFLTFVTGAILRLRVGFRLVLCLFMSMAYGIAQAAHSYEILSVSHFVSGILISLLIYTASIVIALPLALMISKILRSKMCQTQL